MQLPNWLVIALGASTCLIHSVVGSANSDPTTNLLVRSDDPSNYAINADGTYSVIGSDEHLILSTRSVGVATGAIVGANARESGEGEGVGASDVYPRTNAERLKRRLPLKRPRVRPRSPTCKFGISVVVSVDADF